MTRWRAWWRRWSAAGRARRSQVPIGDWPTWSTQAGVVVSESTALSVAAVMSCISLIARTLASLPLHLYRRVDTRTRERADGHPVAEVLRRPTEWQTLSEWITMLQAHVLLRGNAYAYIARDTSGERIVALVPLHPDRVQLEVARDRVGLVPLGYRVTRRDGQVVAIPAREMLHLRGLSTDGVLGRSVIHDAREMIGIAVATQTHAATFWSRGGQPTVVLRHPATLSDAARENLERSWEQTYGTGPDQRRIAVLEDGLTIEQLTLHASDMQFLETRQFQRSEIAGWFHVPPHLIGDVDRSTSWGTGIEQQQIAFLQFTLLPWVRLWERRLTRDLLQEPYYVEFALEGLMRGDSRSQAQYFRTMREIGVFSANDIRALLNLNPIPGGDEYLRPSNLTPMPWVAEVDDD